MGKLIDLSGTQYGRLTVIERANDRIDPQGSKRAYWLCKCTCGKEVEVLGASLRRGSTFSCGCLGMERRLEATLKHNLCKSKIYATWDRMKQRCVNSNSKSYKNYGARGIKVCDKWMLEFSAFYDDVSKLPHFGESGYSIDRIDVNGDYEPNNVRWANRETQANNTRTNRYVTYNGKRQTLAQWAREYNIQYKRFIARINDRGWDFKKALTTPVKKREKHS